MMMMRGGRVQDLEELLEEPLDWYQMSPPGVLLRA